MKIKKLQIRVPLTFRAPQPQLNSNCDRQGETNMGPPFYTNGRSASLASSPPTVKSCSCHSLCSGGGNASLRNGKSEIVKSHFSLCSKVISQPDTSFVAPLV